MDISRKDRLELNALSKEVFGVSSKWQKFAQGIPELVTKTINETIPGENGAPDTTKESVVPVLLENGAKQYKTRIYTVDEIRELLLKYKAQRDAIIAQLKAAEDLKKVQERVQQAGAGGTTV